MFFEIIQQSFRLMKKNLNLTQLIFILFVITMGFAAILAHLKMNVKVIPMFIIFFALLNATSAGIFYAFKTSLDYEKNPPKTDNPFELSPLYLSEFLQGVGKYTPKFIFAGLFSLALLILFALGYNYLVEHFALMPEKFMELTKTPTMWSQVQLNEFFASLNETQMEQMSKFSLITLGIFWIYGILTMFYPVSLINEEKNFFKSFFISIKYLFKNIPISIILFVCFNISFAFANVMSAAFASNILISIVALFLQCYLIVLYILSLFVYYEKSK